MNLEIFAHSDIGPSRTINQDAWIALPEIGFFAIADGMGGHNAGEVAAQETLDFLCEMCRKIKTTDPTELIIEFRFAIEQANLRLQNMGKQNPKLKGMGTTLCCLFWTEMTVLYAHVGDSRIYRLRNQKLELLTEDHSFFTKWLRHKGLSLQNQTPYPYKHVITRSIGGPGKANPEIATTKPLDEDLYFLCSDGFSDLFSLDELESLFQTPPPLSSIGNLLIEQLQKKQGSDNLTFLIVKEGLFSEINLPRQQCDDPSRSESARSDAR